jgi:hypothetical protein
MDSGPERARPTEQPLTLTAEEEQMVRAVVEALRRIQHGSVQIVVQDNRVVQIDTVEKTRLARSIRIG